MSKSGACRETDLTGKEGQREETMKGSENVLDCSGSNWVEGTYMLEIRSCTISTVHCIP